MLSSGQEVDISYSSPSKHNLHKCPNSGTPCIVEHRATSTHRRCTPSAEKLPQQYRVLLVVEDELILPPIVCSTLLWWRNAILFEVLLIALDAYELYGDFCVVYRDIRIWNNNCLRQGLSVTLVSASNRGSVILVSPKITSVIQQCHEVSPT